MNKPMIGTVTFMQLMAFDGGECVYPLERLRSDARIDLYTPLMFRPLHAGETAENIYIDLLDAADDPGAYHPVPSDVIVIRNDVTAATDAYLITEQGPELLNGFWRRK